MLGAGRLGGKEKGAERNGRQSIREKLRVMGKRLVRGRIFVIWGDTLGG